MSTPTTTNTGRGLAITGRGLAITGLLAAILGILGYVAQVAAHRLFAPWYLPCTATFGVILMVLAVRQRRNVRRILALGLIGLLCAAEWAFVLVAHLPEYTGPVAVGEPFPVFTTQRADGTAFTQRDLTGDQRTVIVFFRGRW